MARKPNPLLTEFPDESIPLPTIDWETVPPGVRPADAWEAYDEGVAAFALLQLFCEVNALCPRF